MASCCAVLCLQTASSMRLLACCSSHTHTPCELTASPVFVVVVVWPVTAGMYARGSICLFGWIPQ